MKKWEGKVKYTDLEKVDFFEVYPLYEAPHFILKMITEEGKINVGKMTYQINSDNYFVYPQGYSKDVSEFLNSTERFENFNEDFYVLQYEPNVLSNRGSDECTRQADHGGIWCYARRSRGIFECTLFDVYFTGTHWELLVEHINEVRAGRKQGGIWYATQADQVKVDQSMGVKALVNGVLETQNNSQIESLFNVSSHDIPWLYHFDNIYNGSLAYVESIGTANFYIKDTGGNSCSPKVYELDCDIDN